ncbi:histone-fold-containing protein, partial [Lactarius quietus]
VPPKWKGGNSKIGVGPPGDAKGFQTCIAKAGLQFPISRIHEHRTQKNRRIGAKATVYIAAILAYLPAEVLELAGIASKDLRIKCITPWHLHLAVWGDEELDLLVKPTLPGGGVRPCIIRA